MSEWLIAIAIALDYRTAVHASRAKAREPGFFQTRDGETIYADGFWKGNHGFVPAH